MPLPLLCGFLEQPQETSTPGSCSCYLPCLCNPNNITYWNCASARKIVNYMVSQLWGSSSPPNLNQDRPRSATRSVCFSILLVFAPHTSSASLHAEVLHTASDFFCCYLVRAFHMLFDKLHILVFVKFHIFPETCAHLVDAFVPFL